MRKSIEESSRRGRVSGDDNAARAARMRLEKKLQRIGLHRSDGKRYKLNSLKRLHEKWARAPERVEAIQSDAKLRFKFPTLSPAPSATEELLTLHNACVAFPSSSSSASPRGSR